MPPRRPFFRFGDTTLKRAGDLTPDERRSALLPSSALREVLASADSRALIQLYDQLRNLPRVSSPTREIVLAARRAIERAVGRGDLVGFPIGSDWEVWLNKKKGGRKLCFVSGHYSEEGAEKAGSHLVSHGLGADLLLNEPSDPADPKRYDPSYW